MIRGCCRYSEVSALFGSNANDGDDFRQKRHPMARPEASRRGECSDRVGAFSLAGQPGPWPIVNRRDRAFPAGRRVGKRPVWKSDDVWRGLLLLMVGHSIKGHQISLGVLIIGYAV